MSKVYKLCDCGHMNIFEETEPAPRKCGKCQRNILGKDIFSLDEYEKKHDEGTEEPEAYIPTDTQQNKKGFFKLVNIEKNIEIPLPEQEEFIIGREGIGKEVFGPTISRKHLFVTPTGRLGIRVMDKDSLNGTKINDEVILKGVAKLVMPGDKITLDINEAGITLTLQRIE